MKPEYEPKTLQQKLGYLVEECGEVQAAVGKTMRWGLESSNPELPEAERETNRAWVLRELRDLRRAIDYAEKELARCHCGDGAHASLEGPLRDCPVHGNEYDRCECIPFTDTPDRDCPVHGSGDPWVLAAEAGLLRGGG